jgi:hypothetical protein
MFLMVYKTLGIGYVFIFDKYKGSSKWLFFYFTYLYFSIYQVAIFVMILMHQHICELEQN